MVCYNQNQIIKVSEKINESKILAYLLCTTLKAMSAKHWDYFAAHHP